jgi:ABC-type transporter Mla subunit MlaD
VPSAAAWTGRLPSSQHGGNPEALLEAAGAVIASKRPIAPEHADTISVLTDNLNVVIDTYGEAADAVWRWFRP